MEFEEKRTLFQELLLAGIAFFVGFIWWAAPVHAMILASDYDNSAVNMQTNISYDVIFRMINDDNSHAVIPIGFFISAKSGYYQFSQWNWRDEVNRSITYEGRIGGFHDTMSLLNWTLKREELHIIIFESGEYNMTWGVNLSNGSLYQESFTVAAQGNSTAVMGMNESDQGRPHRFGWTPPPSNQYAWIANLSNLKPIQKMNMSNTSVNYSIYKSVITIAVPRLPSREVAPAPEHISQPISYVNTEQNQQKIVQSIFSNQNDTSKEGVVEDRYYLSIGIIIVALLLIIEITFLSVWLKKK
jgi:hypothetical protein